MILLCSHHSARATYIKLNLVIISGAGTNLKVGGTGPERKWGSPIRREAPEFFFGRTPPLFGSKSTISRFGESFRDGQYSLVSFLFVVLLLTVPPVPSHL